MLFLMSTNSIKAQKPIVQSYEIKVTVDVRILNAKNLYPTAT